MTDGLKLFTRICLKIIILAIIVEFIARGVLIVITPGSLGLNIGQWFGTFILGAINDLCFVTISLLFILLYCLTLGKVKYRKPWNILILLASWGAFFYVSFFNTIFHEYGSVVPLIAQILFGFWAISYSLRLFIPSMRLPWSTVWLWIILGIYVLIIFFNACSEYFFWDEFNVRYNFIAVDYLIYTNEVIGNILESYSILPLLMGIVVILTIVTTRLLFKVEVGAIGYFFSTRWKVMATLSWIIAATVACCIVTFNLRFQTTDNTYYNELQANGPYKFFDAFRKNHLDYQQFYLSLPAERAEKTVHEIYNSTGENLRHITADTTAVFSDSSYPNIVLITLESMSASFMERYGSDKAITPNLDSLATRSLVFDNMFATGNRTVRGLEALTLSLPPCPGESIIKRPDCGGMRSTASVLSKLGYRPFFFYGGNSYFDNMGTFFSSNGYDVVDIADYKPGDITFKNIWGVADEDSYHKAITVMDTVATSGPFFAHIMSISNHRPYTYPEGRIPIPTDSKTRAGGVMYADWALGDFFNLASRQPWFDNTIFIVVADHCASSAGKTDLPLEKYHIPALIYSPAHIEPQAVTKICSQIDLMPTVFSLIGLGYDSYFYGNDILADDFDERAFVATYEDLGYLENGVLTVLSPPRRVEQFDVVATDNNPYNTEPKENIDNNLVDKTISLYQTSATWYHPDRAR